MLAKASIFSIYKLYFVELLVGVFVKSCLHLLPFLFRVSYYFITTIAYIFVILCPSILSEIIFDPILNINYEFLLKLNIFLLLTICVIFQILVAFVYLIF